MISTTLMIRMGRVKGNKMVNMHIVNNKLINRAIRMVMDELGIAADKARELLDKYGSVKKVLDSFSNLKT